MLQLLEDCKPVKTPSVRLTDNVETNQMLLLLLYHDGCVVGQTAGSDAPHCLFCRTPHSQNWFSASLYCAATRLRRHVNTY